MKFTPQTDAVLCIDLQNDFIPGGSLAAPLGDKIVAPCFEFLKRAKDAGVTIVTTRDWHPANHMSFKSQGGLWPPHCVENTKGAEFPNGFPTEIIDIDIRKGTTVDKEAYSGFEGTDLANQLAAKGIKRVFVIGLCTEYCVYSSAMDAKKNNLETFVVEELISEVVPSEKQGKLQDLKANGIHIVKSADIF